MSSSGENAAREFFNEKAQLYNETMRNSSLDSAVSNVILENVKKTMGEIKGEKGIDIGCGNGKFTVSLVEQCKASHVIGTDISDVQIDICKTSYRDNDRLKFVRRSVLAEDTLCQQLDFAVSVMMMHYMSSRSELAQAFKNVANLLKVDGKFTCCMVSTKVGCTNVMPKSTKEKPKPYEVRCDIIPIPEWHPIDIFLDEGLTVTNIAISWQSIEECLTEAGFQVSRGTFWNKPLQEGSNNDYTVCYVEIFSAIKM